MSGWTSFSETSVAERSPVSRAKRLEIELGAAGDHGETDTVAIAADHEGLPDLFQRHADLGGDRLGREIVGIDLVFAQLVRDPQAIEEAGGVGLHAPPSCPVSDAARKACPSPIPSPRGRGRGSERIEITELLVGIP